MLHKWMLEIIQHAFYFLISFNLYLHSLHWVNLHLFSSGYEEIFQMYGLQYAFYFLYINLLQASGNL